jgi:hypothetical protein
MMFAGRACGCRLRIYLTNGAAATIGLAALAAQGAAGNSRPYRDPRHDGVMRRPRTGKALRGSFVPGRKGDPFARTIGRDYFRASQ